MSRSRNTFCNSIPVAVSSESSEMIWCFSVARIRVTTSDANQCQSSDVDCATNSRKVSEPTEIQEKGLDGAFAGSSELNAAKGSADPIDDDDLPQSARGLASDESTDATSTESAAQEELNILSKTEGRQEEESCFV